MLIEGTVGVMALIAAAAMPPGDYFAINTTPAVYATLGPVSTSISPRSRSRSARSVAGRASGAVSLAVGMAQIFTALPGMGGLMAYWYHFAIMFEALFILTTIDAGTRVGRFLLQEFLGRAYQPFSNPAWVPGAIMSTALIVFAWGYFIYTGSVDTIWPMFGVANQLLGVVALSVATTVIINTGQSALRLDHGRAAVACWPSTRCGARSSTSATTTIRWPWVWTKPNGCRGGC